MSLPSNFKHYVQLHFVVLLFGFTAILGKLISIDATNLVLYRMSLATLLLSGIVLLRKKGGLPSKQVFAKAFGVGIIVALHWICFFKAVKISNVSVTLGTMASGTLFVSLLEPLLTGRKMYWVEVLIGLFILFGLYLITQFAFHFIDGILVALLSAFLAALFGILNRQITIQGHDSISISGIEMFSGSLVIFGYLFFSKQSLLALVAVPSGDWIWIFVLAWVCTAYAFVATVYLLKYLETYTVTLAINLEPVYGIIMAYLIFGESEKMHAGFYLGTLLILVSLFIHPFLMRRFHKI